jgi:hypothetical protein
MGLGLLQLRFNRSPRLLIRFDGGYIASCGAQWRNRTERPAAKGEQDGLPSPERANDCRRDAPPPSIRSPRCGPTDVQDGRYGWFHRESGTDHRGGNSHGTACRPWRRYVRKSSRSTVQILHRAVSSVMRTRQASARSIERSEYFRHSSSSRGTSRAKTNVGSRTRSPRLSSESTPSGEPSTHAVSRITASHV